MVVYTSVSPKKYLNLELCGPRNLLLSTASSVTKLQFGGFQSSFVTLDVVLNYKFLGLEDSDR